MALDSDLVRVAVTGAVSVGATTATAPTDASSALSAGTDEVQTVTLTGATGGTFTLTYSGQTTTAIAYSAAASAVQSALEALSNLAPGDVAVTGSAGGPYSVTFDGDAAALTASGTSLTGTTPTVVVAVGTPGVDGFADLGYVGEDGVNETRDRSTNTIKGWQNGDIVREVVTEASITFAFTMIETKKETVELYYGSAVDSSDGSIVIVPATTGGRKSFVLDVIDGDEFIRAYVPQGEVVEVGEQVYANGEPIGYPVTIRGYYDATLGGSAKKWYSSLAS